MPRYLPLAPQMPRRRDFFVEGVADRRYFIYRLYHRPSGLVVQFVFEQGRKLPLFNDIVDGLLCEMMQAMHAPEEPFYAPVA